MEDDVWDENRYKNWVRGAKGLELLQEGLKDFVGDKAPVCRDEVLRKILAVPIGPLPQCNQCTSENLLPEHANSKKACGRTMCVQQNARNCFGSKYIGRRKCPTGICCKLYDAIVLEHLHRDPLWKNTDPTTWCSDPKGWSFAKCFETIPGPGISALDTDAAGLLSILLNSLSMQNWLSCQNMGSKTACPFYKARDIRNEILHKAKMELDDQTLDGYLDTFITVLEDPKCLKTYRGSPDSVKKLTELKYKQIHISQKDEKRILKLRKEALSELEERKQEAMQEIEDRTSSGVQKIKDETSIGLSAAENAKTEAVQKIKDETSKGLSTAEKAKTETVQKIKDETSIGLSVAEKAKTESVLKIKNETSIGLSMVEKAKREAVQKIEDETNIGLSAAKKRKMDAVQKIKEETSTVLSTAEQKIKDETSRGLATVVQKIKDETSTALSTVVQKISDIERKTVSEVSAAGSETVAIIYDRREAILTEFEGAKSNMFEEHKRQKDLTRATDGQDHVTSLDGQSSKKISARYTTEVQAPVVAADQAYIQLKARLQDDLIEFYRSQHSTILLSPLIEEDDTPLLEFYVMPDIHAVKRDRQGTKEEKTSVSTLRNVFYKDDKLCKEIYLTADAGLGKTSLSKRLTLAWCHAKSPNSNEKACFSEEFKEIDAMGEFAFVFLLLLRDSHKECEIDKLIWNQIVSRLENNYTLEDLQNIMSKERSLVILDGLDEWTHPSNNCDHGQSSIPHRRIRKNCTILTTTRPWKLSVSYIKSSQIDQKFEIAGLSPQAANTLKKSVISHIKNVKGEYQLRRQVYNFTEAVEEKHLSALETNPLLLMYLICLWCDNIELGQSQSELYSKIVELLLSRTVKKYKKDKDSLPEVESAQCNIPPCFSKQTHCRKFYTILTALGQLAFQTLFKETKEENTLVFDSSVAEQYLNKDCLTFCLSTGIITQSKVQIKLAEIQEPKVSFAHKTLQEFFAALYMHSTPDHTSVSEIVASKCKCVKDVLDMSTILKFIIGMNVNVASSISRELMKIINGDEITRKYRNTLDVNVLDLYRHPLKDFQHMRISCCKELPRENEVSLCLQDVFIEESCKQEQYREHLKQLTTRNTQNIRSLYIDMDHMEFYTLYDSVQKVVEYFALNGLENIEKIDCQGNGDDILPLLYRSVKYLSLSYGSWSRLLREKVATLQKLEAIKISQFAMSHSELTLLCDYISHRHCMRQIVLEELRCTDYEWSDSCTAILDLSQHSQLSELTLVVIPVRTVNVNMAALEKCCLVELYNEDLVLRFVNCDPADSKLNTFECWRLQSRAAIDTVLDTLPGLHQVEHVELLAINLGDRELKLSSEMKNLERVELERVTMAASSLRGVVDCVDQLPQTVEVDIEDCRITPEREFVTVRDKIKTSPRFTVSKDNKDKDRDITLKFVTIKE